MSLEEYFEIETLKELYNDRLISSKAKGIDKINSLSFNLQLDKELEIINKKILDGTYKFSVYIEKLKLKGRNKPPRIISIPTLRDRLVLLTIKEILHEQYPECINDKLPNRYIRDIKRYLNNSSNNYHYLKLDIEKFYDNINREILINMLKEKINDERIINLINAAICTPSIPINTKVFQYVEYMTEVGVPQGLSISNILAQIYVNSLDHVIDKRQYFYRRYVDDIIVLNDKEISNFRYKNIQKALSDIKLSLNENKTEKGSLDNGFTYLSYKIMPNVISIADASVENFIRRIAGKFTWFKNGIKNRNNRAEWLVDDNRFKEVFIEELNETITGIISSTKNYGWLFYFSEMNDEALLFKLDNIINRFFISLDSFNNEAPKELKRLSRTYRVIKHKGNKNYLCNYDNYDSIRRKRNYLIFRGKIDPEINYTDEDINRLFLKFKTNQIKNLEKDIGYKYF